MNYSEQDSGLYNDRYFLNFKGKPTKCLCISSDQKHNIFQEKRFGRNQTNLEKEPKVKTY